MTDPPHTADAVAPWLSWLTGYVHRETGILLNEKHAVRIASTLRGMATRHEGETAAELVNRLRTTGDPDLAQDVIDAATTNETSFYRNRHTFDALAEIVLPQILSQRPATQPLRVWSAACATGQEPYTLATLLLSRFPDVARAGIDILGTDICVHALATATNGRYRLHEIQRGLSKRERHRFFHHHQGTYEVSPQIREIVRFKRFNLVRDTCREAPFDVIFLRNVLIYFDPPTRQAVLTKMHQHLARRGALFIGATEGATSLPPGLFTRHGDRAIWLRRQDDPA